MNFDLNQSERKKVWEFTNQKIEHFYSKTEDYRASIYPERNSVLENVISDFEKPRETIDAIDHVVQGLSKYAVHTPHPNYYGMFNPRTNFPSVIADVITAVFNPQLAAWGHAPYATEIEHMLIREFGKKFGMNVPDIDGVFTSGGQEANLTAVLSALNYKIPNYAKQGIRVTVGLPTIYCSEFSHHSTVKAARVCGLGSDSIRYIAVNDRREMIVDELELQIEKDINEGSTPLMIIATMGTTGAGAIDQINQLSTLAKRHDLWLHADAAYGGALALAEKYRHLLSGIEKADSITFDAHKWLSVPMATSMYITKHPDILGKTFSIQSDYMPKEESEIDRLSSYTHSIQWSRRFIGLKLYMSMLVFGWKGYDETLSKQIEMGQLLKHKLVENNWQLYNDTELPIACFNDPQFDQNEDFTSYIYESFLETGEAWINKYPIDDKFTLRACITNYATGEKHINELISLLNQKRKAYMSN